MEEDNPQGMKLSHVEVTHVGLTRKENQDSIFALPEHGVFLVADGMGGEKAGAEASAQVVATVNRLMSEYFQKFDPQGPADVEGLVKKSLELASKEVLQIAAREPDKMGMGSTGSLMILHRGAYFLAQVGDSRIYLLRKGRVQQLTRDHTIVWTLYESGILSREQLETHPDRHLLTQCIGGSKPVEVEIFADRVQQGDVFLLCSDGLTGYAGEEKVMRLLADQVYNLEELGQRLLQAALEGGGGDNVSVILAKVESLDPQDNWTLEGSPTPKFAPAVVPPPAKEEKSAAPPTPAKRPASHRVGLYAALFFFVAIFLLVAAIAKRKRDFVEIKFQTERALSLEDIKFLDEDGNAVDLADATLEKNTLAMNVPRGAKYSVKVDHEGVVPVEKAIDFSEYTGNPLKVVVLEFGKLEITPGANSGISELRIVEIAPGASENDEPKEVAVIYEFPGNGDSAAKLMHEIKPRVPHNITVKDSQGRVMSFTVEVQPGRTETISAEF